MGIIRFDTRSSYPCIAPADETMCLACGHCVAVCPRDALSHRYSPRGASPKIRKQLAINEQQALQFLRSRRSIRLFRDKPVETEKIKRLIEVARFAPTGGNGQLVEWLVLTDKSQINRIAAMTVEYLLQSSKEDPRRAAAQAYVPLVIASWDAGHDIILRQAPALVVASAPKEAHFGADDVIRMLTYLELFAPTMGLGTCWAGLLQAALLSSPQLKDVVGIPAGHPYHFPMMLGYPKIRKYYRLPERRPPKITFK